MARRRYISTDISVDTRVNKLAERFGGDAALLYTWMIPHANDQGELTADPEELLYIVFPGRRSLESSDIWRWIDGMLALDLIEHDEHAGLLRFPEDAFYKYQSYVKYDVRRHSADTSVNQRKALRNSEEQQQCAQTSASVSSPVPVPVPVSPPVLRVPAGSADAADAATPTCTQIFKHYKARIQPSARLDAHKQIALRLATFSPGDLKHAIDKFAADAWWMEHNGSRGAPWFFKSDARIEQFMNITRPPPKKNGQTAVICTPDNLEELRRKYGVPVNGVPQ